MKISYEIHYHNLRLNYNQYNTFHNCTLHEAIEKLHERGFDKSTIIAIKEKTVRTILPDLWRKG